MTNKQQCSLLPSLFYLGLFTVICMFIYAKIVSRKQGGYVTFVDWLSTYLPLIGHSSYRLLVFSYSGLLRCIMYIFHPSISVS